MLAKVDEWRERLHRWCADFDALVGQLCHVPAQSAFESLFTFSAGQGELTFCKSAPPVRARRQLEMECPVRWSQ